MSLGSTCVAAPTVLVVACGLNYQSGYADVNIPVEGGEMSKDLGEGSSVRAEDGEALGGLLGVEMGD